MSRIKTNNKILLLLVLLIMFSLYGCNLKNHGTKEATQIFEIQNTQQLYYDPDSKVATIEKNYMIINEPEDLHKLKKLIEKYNNDSPIDMKIIKKLIEEAEITYDDIGKIDILIKFYRESKDLPRDWHPNEAYFNIDRIEYHNDDCIASIVWSKEDPKKRYSVMKKSLGTDDPILIEEIEYIDDKIVNHEYSESENK